MNRLLMRRRDLLLGSAALGLSAGAAQAFGVGQLGANFGRLGAPLGGAGNILTVSGGVVTTSGARTIRTFNSSGTLTASQAFVADILVVGGAGGGSSGGGGAGEVKYLTSVIIPAGSSTITVGAGGAIGIVQNPGTLGGNGSSSSLGNVATALGGGGGGAAFLSPGNPGACGGGAPSTGSGAAAATGSVGFNGGSNSGFSGNYPAAGGGGMGGLGGNAASTVAGGGGAGISNSISGSAVFYGGGGGGGAFFGGSTGGLGGSGVGGNGHVGSTAATNPVANSGSGGGGETQGGTPTAGAAGTVIISYPTPALTMVGLAGDRAQFPVQAITNTNSYTQVQQYYSFTAVRNVLNPKFLFGNFARTTFGTSVAGPSNLTLKLALWDGTNAPIPLTWNAAPTITLVPGAQAWTDPAAGTELLEGRRYSIVELATWATAPATFPAAAFNIFQIGANASQWGNSLTDETANPSAITGQIANYMIATHLAVSGTIPAGSKSVAILGDSIGTGDGIISNACLQAGIPYVDLGISGLSYVTLFSNSSGWASLLGVIQASGVTHLISTLWVNDLVNQGQTAAQIYANMQLLASDLATIGVKLIVVSPQPLTNSANTGEQTAGQWAVRTALYNLVVAGNGVGNGYIDFYTGMSDAATHNLWRTDVNTVPAVAVFSGGMRYVVNDVLFLANNVALQVSSVSSGGVITGVSTGGDGTVGGFLTGSPSGAPVSFGPYGINAVPELGYGFSLGSGASFTLTAASGGSPTTDGTHPNPPWYLMMTGQVASFISGGGLP